jgi:hypothetical protein
MVDALHQDAAPQNALELLGRRLIERQPQLIAWLELQSKEAQADMLLAQGAKPRGEVECALVMQMACTHTAAMAVLGTLGGAHGSDRNVAMKASAAARLLRAYAAQVEVLRRLRNGGSQFVRVEHVHVNARGSVRDIESGPGRGDQGRHWRPAPCAEPSREFAGERWG